MGFGRKKLKEKAEGRESVDLSPKAEINQALEYMKTMIQYLAAIHEGQQQIYNGMEELFDKIEEGGKKK